jgi:hypothetical protein
MSAPILNRVHINGYDVLSVNHGPWRVCTDTDRLGSFNSREEACAYAASLPARTSRQSRSSVAK